MAQNREMLSKLIEIINSKEKGLEPYAGGKAMTPTGKTNEFKYAGGGQAGLDEYMKEAQAKGLDVSGVKSASDLQSRIYDSLMSTSEGQGVIKNMWSEYGDTLKGSGKVLPKNLSSEDLASFKKNFVDNMLGARTQMVLSGLKPRQEAPPQAAQPPVQGMQYTGEPVYLPGIKGATGGTISNALVGFLNKTGEFNPIQQQDYSKYAVPTWAQESLAAGGADQYLRSKLGEYYKGTKK